MTPALVLLLYILLSPPATMAEIYLPCEEGQFVNQAGCTCWNPQHPIIRCISLGLTTFPDITKAYAVDLAGNDFGTVPARGFREAVGLRKLSVSDCRLTAVSYDAFDGVQQTLESLDLSRNELTEVPAILKATNGSGLKQLTTLDLSENFIAEIGEAAFIGLSKLQNLRLDGNWITRIHPDSWRGLAAQQGEPPSHFRFSISISAGGMAVTSIPSKHLGNVTSLRFVGGQPEKLSTLSAWLERFPLLQRLEMTRMNLQDGHLEGGHLPAAWKHQLRSLILRDNLLASVPWRLLDLPLLEELDLSGNVIEEFRADSHSMLQMQRLNLSDNRMWRVHCDLLLMMAEATSIDLSNNRLRWLNWSLRNIDASFGRQMALRLGGNPWACICGYSWMAVLVDRQLATRNGHLSRYEIDHTIRCASPASLRGKLVRDARDAFDCSSRSKSSRSGRK